VAIIASLISSEPSIPSGSGGGHQQDCRRAPSRTDDDDCDDDDDDDNDNDNNNNNNNSDTLKIRTYTR